MRIIHLWHSSWNHSPNFEWSLSVLTGKGWIHDYQMHIWISSWSSYTQPQCKSSASSVSKIRKIVKLADLPFKSFVGQLQRREKGFSLRSRMLYIIKVWKIFIPIPLFFFPPRSFWTWGSDTILKCQKAELQSYLCILTWFRFIFKEMILLGKAQQSMIMFWTEVGTSFSESRQFIPWIELILSNNWRETAFFQCKY